MGLRKWPISTPAKIQHGEGSRLFIKEIKVRRHDINNMLFILGIVRMAPGWQLNW
jgi:hypothetical protein